jgi:hypothetical protein
MSLVKRFCFILLYFAFVLLFLLFEKRLPYYSHAGYSRLHISKAKPRDYPSFMPRRKTLLSFCFLVCFFCFPKTAYFTRATGLVAVCTFQKQNSSTYYFLRATRDTERSTQKVSTTRRLYLLNKYLPSIYLLSIYILYYRGDERTFEEPKAKVFNTSHQLPPPRWQSSSASSSCGGRTLSRN